MEQVERTRRYLTRLRRIYSGVPYPADTREYLVDDALSFVMHCHHIRDWIIHLNRAGITERDVDAFIDQHLELRICADLCNGTKHYRLTRKKRTPRQPHLAGRRFVSTGMGDEIRTTKGKFLIVSDQTILDALELAEACMTLWEAFILKIESTANSATEDVGTMRRSAN